uniref:Iron-sulfur cluster assembly enzyme n=1 Tax=Salmo trutta TaxID=8032 RepID=A0A674EUI4_SALTR
MAGLIAAKKCITPLVVIKRLSYPEYKAQAAYHKKVVDHYENPRNVGSLDKTSKNVGTGLVGAPACGDVMKLQIEVDDHGKIVDARFKTFGCGSAIASSSLVTEWVKGKSVSECSAPVTLPVSLFCLNVAFLNSSLFRHAACLFLLLHIMFGWSFSWLMECCSLGFQIDEALTIQNTDIAKELCLPPVKLHCSMLAEDAIKAALHDYRLKQDGKIEAVKASN